MFTGWSGALTGQGASITVSMAAHNIIATFSSQAQAAAAGFNMAQTLSDRAQADDVGVRWLGANDWQSVVPVVFPTGQSGRLFRFQYLRDNDPDNMDTTPTS